MASGNDQRNYWPWPRAVLELPCNPYQIGEPMGPFSRLAAIAICAMLATGSGRAFAKSSSPSATLPLTTRSAPARQHFEKGMTDLENLRTDEALDEWRKAAAADPNFALAHIMTASETRDPSEKKAERDHAKQLAARATAGEKLLVTWL